jgi:hypothetical protein
MSRETLPCVLQECFVFYSLVGVATDSYDGDTEFNLALVYSN